MVFIMFENPELETSVLVCTDMYGKLICWCEYLSSTNIGIFHDNSPVNPAAINNKTATIISEASAKNILLNVAESTAKTCAGHYAVEIKEFLSNECPF